MKEECCFNGKLVLQTILQSIWSRSSMFKTMDGQQQMDTQARHVGPLRKQKERGATTDEIG